MSGGKNTSVRDLPTDPKATSDTSSFDMWLKRGLHQLFDEVANEPIPDELLKLIENDRER